jgi:hypothetical protein
LIDPITDVMFKLALPLLANPPTIVISLLSGRPAEP